MEIHSSRQRIQCARVSESFELEKLVQEVWRSSPAFRERSDKEDIAEEIVMWSASSFQISEGTERRTKVSMDSERSGTSVAKRTEDVEPSLCVRSKMICWIA